MRNLPYKPVILKLVLMKRNKQSSMVDKDKMLINDYSKKDSLESLDSLISQNEKTFDSSVVDSEVSDDVANQLPLDSENCPLLANSTRGSLPDISSIDGSIYAEENSSAEMNDLILECEGRIAEIKAADTKFSFLDTENPESPFYVYKKGYVHPGIVGTRVNASDTHSWKSMISHPGFGLAVFFLLSSCFFVSTLMSGSVNTPLTRYPRNREGSIFESRYDETTMLSRLFNAIYLQNGVYSPRYNLSVPLIAGDMFGIPDVNMIQLDNIEHLEKTMESLHEMPPGKDRSSLKKNLEELKTLPAPEIKSVPDKDKIEKVFESLKNLHDSTFTNVFPKETEDKLKTLTGTIDTFLRKIDDPVPDVLYPSQIDDILKSYNQTMDKVEEQVDSLAAPLKRHLDPYANFKDQICDDKPLREMMTSLFELVGFNETVNELRTREQDLLATLFATKESIDQLYSSVDSKDVETALKMSETLEKLIKAFLTHDSSKTEYMPAFPRGVKDYKDVWDSFSDPWMMQTLNQAHGLDQLLQSLRPIMELMRQLHETEQFWTEKRKEDLWTTVTEDRKTLTNLYKTDEQAKQAFRMESFEQSKKNYEDLISSLKERKESRVTFDLPIIPTKEEFGNLLQMMNEECDRYVQLIGTPNFQTFFNLEYFKNVVKTSRVQTSINDFKNAIKGKGENGVELQPFIVMKNGTVGIVKLMKEFNTEAGELKKQLDAFHKKYQGIKDKDYKVDDLLKKMSIGDADRKRIDSSIQLLDIMDNRDTAMTRAKRDTSSYKDMVVFRQNITDLNSYMLEWINGFGTVLPIEGLMLREMEVSKPLSYHLGYAQRVMGALAALDRAINTIQKDGPIVDEAFTLFSDPKTRPDHKSVWASSSKIADTLKKFKQDVARLEAEFSKDTSKSSTQGYTLLEEYGTIYQALDTIKPPALPTSDMKNSLKSLARQPKMSPSQNLSIANLIDVMDLLDGLNYVKMKKDGSVGDLLTQADQSFGHIYKMEKVRPFDFNNVIAILALFLFLHIIPAGWFYRHELYMMWFIDTADKANVEVTPVPEPASEPQPPKEIAWVPVSSNAPKGIEKIEGNLIWDVPPRAGAGKDAKGKSEKHSWSPPIQCWLPFSENQFKDPPNIDYDSDDLRSIDTSTISTQSAPSDYLDSTRSDRTMLEESISDDEELDHVKNPGGKEEEQQDWEAQRGARGAFLLKDFFTTMGLNQNQAWARVQREAKEEYQRELRVQEAEDTAAHGGVTKQERDQQMYQKWARYLAKNAEEIMHKRINNKEFARVLLMLEAIDEMRYLKEKRARTAAENVAYYVEESYVADPEEEVSIAEGAWKSIDRIDNYIHASAQDKWDHLYRCEPPRHCHDWCRVRMSKDFEDDIDFYDACWVYPWLEVFRRVYHKYKNKLICASSPLHKCTVGVLWHWLYENKVKFMVVLNADVERTIHSDADWFPRKVGEAYKCRRNREREYVVRLVEAKKDPKRGGVERKFVITLIRCNQRIHSKSIKILFMHNWEQDGMVKDWQAYVPILERITLHSFGKPVVVMSKHGSGRAMTVILSIMMAVMAHFDNDVGIHSMVQAGRASKRQAIVVFNQVYVWRIWHYEMLFKWHLDKIYHLRACMDERFDVYLKQYQKHLAEFVEEQRHGIWFIHYNYEVTRYERFWSYTSYYQAWDLSLEYRKRRTECLEEGSHPCPVLQAYVPKDKKDAIHEYDSLVPIRRRPLRKGDDKRDPKRERVEYAGRKELSFAETATFEYFEHLMVPEVWKFKGRNQLMHLKDYKEKRAKGAQYVEAWKTWVDKEQQKGIVKPGDQLTLPWQPKPE